MLNSRECAIVTLVVALAVVVLAIPQAREQVPQLLRGLASRAIILPLVALSAWVTLLVAGAARIGLWNSGLIKDTVVWFVASAFGSVFAALEAAKTDRYFRSAAIKAVGAVIVLQYAMNLHTFSYLAELALQVVIVLLTCLLVVVERDTNLKQVHLVLVTVNALIILTLLALTVREVTANWDTLDTRQVLLGLALSIWLPLAVLPFIWALALCLSYDTLLGRMRKPVFGQPAPLRTRVATVAALGPDVRTVHDLSNDHNDLQTIARTGTWGETLYAVHVYRRRRDRRRAEPELALRRLRRFAGAKGVDVRGRQLDQREMEETREALHWLADCHAGHHHNLGRYRVDLMNVLGGFARQGLPEDHGVQMTVAKAGGSWFAWRRTPSGLVLGISALADPTDRWFYAGQQPPTGPPPHGGAWEQGSSNSPDWRR